MKAEIYVRVKGVLLIYFYLIWLHQVSVVALGTREWSGSLHWESGTVALDHQGSPPVAFFIIKMSRRLCRGWLPLINRLPGEQTLARFIMLQPFFSPITSIKVFKKYYSSPTSTHFRLAYNIFIVKNLSECNFQNIVNLDLYKLKRWHHSLNPK